jgi:hypothetical protein
MIGVGGQLGITLLNRAQKFDQRSCGIAFQRAVLGVAASQYRRVCPGGHSEDRQEVRHTWFCRRVKTHLAVGVGHSSLHLLLDRLGVFEQINEAAVGIGRLRHFRRWILQVHDPSAHLGNGSLGNHKGFAIPRVKPLRDVSSDLKMLALVVTDRDLVSVVEQDVGGHERWVREQACGDKALVTDSV